MADARRLEGPMHIAASRVMRGPGGLYRAAKVCTHARQPHARCERNVDGGFPSDAAWRAVFGVGRGARRESAATSLGFGRLGLWSRDVARLVGCVVCAAGTLCA
eukprot:2842567-Prymnesium_polylepis.3